MRLLSASQAWSRPGGVLAHNSAHLWGPHVCAPGLDCGTRGIPWVILHGTNVLPYCEYILVCLIYREYFTATLCDPLATNVISPSCKCGIGWVCSNSGRGNLLGGEWDLALITYHRVIKQCCSCRNALFCFHGHCGMRAILGRGIRNQSFPPKPLAGLILALLYYHCKTLIVVTVMESF